MKVVPYLWMMGRGRFEAGLEVGFEACFEACFTTVSDDLIEVLASFIDFTVAMIFVSEETDDGGLHGFRRFLIRNSAAESSESLFSKLSARFFTFSIFSESSVFSEFSVFTPFSELSDFSFFPIFSSFSSLTLFLIFP